MELNQYLEYNRRYKGLVRLVVLDWAGVTVDYGCYAPAVAFIEVFRRKGIAISIEQARGPMGRYKRDHIKCIFEWYPDVSIKWKEKYGREWTDADVGDMFENLFKPIQLEVIRRFSKLIPGTIEAVERIRSKGVKIGSTTGYFREASEINLEEASKQGYRPDATFCSDDVPAGRPRPWMVMRNMMETDVYPPAAVVKVDDTVVGVEEGLNAGTWAVGISKTGTLVGLDEEEIRDTPTQKLRSMIEEASDKLRRAGAHYVIESISQLPPIVERIEERLRRGETP